MKRIPTWFVALLVVVFVVGFVSVALADDVKGTIKSVDADKGTITVTVDGKDTTYNVDKAAKVSVGGKDSKLGDLKAGGKVTLKTKKDGDKVTVTDITGS